ncbi:hypothetical protein DSECCO2_00190 [anaerobic digester metagenome]
MKVNGHISGDSMKKCCTIFVSVLLFAGLCILCPVLAANVVHTDQENAGNLILSVKTDRAYYAPGDIIRIKGTIVDGNKQPVIADLLFQFQEMNKTGSSGTDGSFLVTVPISLVEPENMYRLVISSQKDGFPGRNISIPIIIMGEPSSLAPVPTIPDEFTTT